MRPLLLILLVLGWMACQPSEVKDQPPGLARAIRDYLVMQGQQEGGNPVEVHALNVVDALEETKGQWRVHFWIDLTRYPTSGLAPDYPRDTTPVRLQETHEALLQQGDTMFQVLQVSLR